jgi:Retrotransposon gag protein
MGISFKTILPYKASSPFTPEIRLARRPRRFMPPKFVKYEPGKDPISHLSHFQHLMGLYDDNDALFCKVFPSSLGEMGIRWFDKLTPGSINSFDQLATKFVERFVASTRQAKDVGALFALRMGPNETTRQYTKRYWDLFNELEDVPDATAIASFRGGLDKEGDLYKTLYHQKPKDVNALMERISVQIELEESKTGGVPAVASASPLPAGKFPYVNGKKEVYNVQGLAGQPKGEFKDYTTIARTTKFDRPLYKVLLECKDQPWFQGPPADLGDQPNGDKKARCSYHKAQGHYTVNCNAFKDFLETVVAAGHLGQYVVHRNAPAGDDVPRLVIT